MLTLPPDRLAHEAQRAREIQDAERMLWRERWGWFGAGIVTVWIGCGMVAMGFHVDRGSIANVWIASGLLVGELGPMVVLLIAVKREER